MSDIDLIITISGILIALFLLLKFAPSGGSSSVIGSIGGVFTQGVGALMGPNNSTRGGN